MRTRTKQPKDFETELRSFVKQQLRRVSMRWYYRNEAIRNARIERGVYSCNLCKNLIGYSEFHVDHIEPVIDIKAPDFTFDEFIRRLLLKTDGYQVLCIPCHENKTQKENTTRNINKKRKRKRKYSVFIKTR